MEELLDGDSGLEINEWHIRLYSGPVQCRGSSFAAVFAGLVPWRGTDREALRGRNDLMEGVEHRTGNESGLISDPEMTNGIKGVREDDSLCGHVSYNLPSNMYTT